MEVDPILIYRVDYKVNQQNRFFPQFDCGLITMGFIWGMIPLLGTDMKHLNR
jgi:hypothetical protein